MLNIKNTLHKSLFNFVIEGSYDKPIPRIYNDPAGEVVHITEKTYKILIYIHKIIKNGIITKMAIIGKLNIL